MQFRLRSLFTQFTLRDLFWLLVVAASLSLAYREHLLAGKAIIRETRALAAESAARSKALDDFSRWVDKHGAEWDEGFLYLKQRTAELEEQYKRRAEALQRDYERKKEEAGIF